MFGFTNSRTSGPNKWYANSLALFCLVLSYGASSTMLFRDFGGLQVNGAAILAMGIGLAGQTAIALWCLLLSRQRNIPTWSSNPLNVTLAALHRGRCTRQPGRCMVSVHQRHQKHVTGSYSLEQQGSIWGARPSARFVMVALWVLAITAIIWPIATFVIAIQYGHFDAWSPFNWDEPGREGGGGSENAISLPISSLGGAAQATVCVLFLCLVQSLQTLGLHGAELLVNVTRDESTWCEAYSSKRRAAKGARVRADPLLSAASSWENATLFFAKSVVHWIIGQSITQKSQDLALDSYTFTIDIRYSRLVIYAVVAVILAGFATFLAFRRREGGLPATMGHLPTLANLIDDWQTDDKGRLWWGDKSPVNLAARAGPTSAGPVVRHAGTSSDKKLVGLVHEHCLYAG